mgnify:CR=1 FL=1
MFKTPFEDPVNIYSIIHFIENGILAFFPKVRIIHVLVISFSWELLELIIPFNWANESFLNKFADILFYVEKPKESAYKIEGLEVATTGVSTEKETKVVQAVDIKALLAMGDLSHGEKVFKKCTACHQIADGGKNMIGPNLWGVIGRTAGSISDYKYSKAMVAYAKEWSFEEMNSYLIKPQAYIKGTKMAFAGLRKEKDRASVILFMNSKSSSPKPLP